MFIVRKGTLILWRGTNFRVRLPQPYIMHQLLKPPQVHRRPPKSSQSSSMTFYFLSLICLLSCFAVSEASDSSTLQTYIVHVHGEDLAAFSSHEDRVRWYSSFLPSQSRLIYSYSRVLSGFAVRLNEQELEELKKKTGFLHAHVDRVLHLQTTHTPAFLGLQPIAAGLWNQSGYGRGTIIGLLDTGVSPDHPSFADTGLPPPPAKWKGVCEFNTSSCNNKLIGVRDFTQHSSTSAANIIPNGAEASAKADELSGPYDLQGHGTHTASTAAGNFVSGANVSGVANGTAAGMAPQAHVAVYKVCMQDSCLESDILAGMDSAVADGVDVLSLSLGGPSLPLYIDSIAVAAFGATERGVFVSCAAGNSGPEYYSLSNEAPWILTVGASTTDRLIRTTITLGSGEVFDGQSAYQPANYAPAAAPLIYPGFTGGLAAALCVNGSLDGIDVRGKIVLCFPGNVSRVTKGMVVMSEGGIGMIIANQEIQGSITFASADVLPASNVDYMAGKRIASYATSATSPTATIEFKGTFLGDTPAPTLAFFSSRGPSLADPNVLKPDVIGPGVNILAAWPFPTGPAGIETPFNIISGTSMSTPHLSGIAALLLSAHPDWSPAAIKSAIMTTTYLTANDGNPIVDHMMQPADFFSIGAGHVDPVRASAPGLVYDIDTDSYLKYLCGLQYTDEQLSALARRIVNCSVIGSILPQNLNYPSIMVFLNAANNYTEKVVRTLTNVGAAGSAYMAQITQQAADVRVVVTPDQLNFAVAGERIQIRVDFSGSRASRGSFSQGYLKWVSNDGSTTVGSPLLVAVN